MTHDYTVLARTQNGCVLQCTGCKRLQINFGNVVLIRDRKGFATFKSSIENVKAHRAAADVPQGLTFVVGIRENELAFAFSRKEVIELFDLLAGAKAMLESGNIMQTTLHGVA